MFSYILIKRIIMKIRKKKVTIAKQTANREGTADNDKRFSESVEKKLSKLRWSIQKNIKKFP